MEFFQGEEGALGGTWPLDFTISKIMATTVAHSSLV